MRFGRLAALVVAAALTAGAAHAQVAADPVKAAQFNALIERAQTAIGHWNYNTQLDVFRAKLAGGFELSKLEQIRMWEMAANRGVWIEADAALAPLVATGEVGGPGDPQRERNLAGLKIVQLKAQANRAGGLLRQEEIAPLLASGKLLLVLGEEYLAAGDYQKALDLIQKGIDKGGLADEDAPFAQLQLGIAQFRSGRVPEARATWNAIRSDKGAQELAQAWLVIASD